MINPVSTMAYSAAGTKTINKTAGNLPNTSTDASEQKAVTHTVPKSDSSDNTQVNIKGRKDRTEANQEPAKDRIDPKKKIKLKGEKRDFGIEDGTFLARVYSNKGKLLREIPPGFIPLNERNLNITV